MLVENAELRKQIAELTNKLDHLLEKMNPNEGGEKKKTATKKRRITELTPQDTDNKEGEIETETFEKFKKENEKPLPLPDAINHAGPPK